MKELIISEEAYDNLQAMAELLNADSFSEAIIQAKIELYTRKAVTFDGVGE